MIQIISGKKGSGKTKRLIDMTNQTVKNASTSVIFIDKDTSYTREIDHDVRFINAADYGVCGGEKLLGFLCGILGSNYDIGTVFVDAFLKLYKDDLATAEGFFSALEQLSVKNNVNFVLSVSADPAELPSFVNTYVI